MGRLAAAERARNRRNGPMKEHCYVGVVPMGRSPVLSRVLCRAGKLGSGEELYSVQFDRRSLVSLQAALDEVVLWARERVVNVHLAYDVRLLVKS